jgi:hypothetical protein
MPALTLGPDEYTTLEYILKRKGPIEFEIDADAPVRTYVVGPKGLQRFEEGSKTFKYWGGFPDPRASQKQKVWIPWSGPWYLIVTNPSKHESVGVDYEVFY